MPPEDKEWQYLLIWLTGQCYRPLFTWLLDSLTRSSFKANTAPFLCPVHFPQNERRSVPYPHSSCAVRAEQAFLVACLAHDGATGGDHPADRGWPVS